MPGGEVHRKSCKSCLKDRRHAGGGIAQPSDAALHETGEIFGMNSGHLDWRRKYYTHFTSPIRRYPDLQIHRIIKECLRQYGCAKNRPFEKILPEVAIQTSALERRADEAERETDKISQYMDITSEKNSQGHFRCHQLGLLCRALPNTVEGLVHVNELRGTISYLTKHTMSWSER